MTNLLIDNDNNVMSVGDTATNLSIDYANGNLTIGSANTLSILPGGATGNAGDVLTTDGTQVLSAGRPLRATAQVLALTSSAQQFQVNAPTCSSSMYLKWTGTTFICSPPAWFLTTNGAASPQTVSPTDIVSFNNGTGTTAIAWRQGNITYNLNNTGVTAANSWFNHQRARDYCRRPGANY